MNLCKWKPRCPQCLNPDVLSWEIISLRPVSFSPLLSSIFLLLTVFPKSFIFIHNPPLPPLPQHLFLFTLFLVNLQPPLAWCKSIRLVKVRAVTWGHVILSTAVNPSLQMHDWPVNARCAVMVQKKKKTLVRQFKSLDFDKGLCFWLTHGFSLAGWHVSPFWLKIYVHYAKYSPTNKPMNSVVQVTSKCNKSLNSPCFFVKIKMQSMTPVLQVSFFFNTGMHQATSKLP